jgi:hypothetical protein
VGLRPGAGEVECVWRWVTSHLVIFRILCVSASEGVGGALMALVRSRWGLGGAREEKMNMKSRLRVGRNIYRGRKQRKL